MDACHARIAYLRWTRESGARTDWTPCIISIYLNEHNY